jgi:hypothetical protein
MGWACFNVAVMGGCPFRAESDAMRIARDIWGLLEDHSTSSFLKKSLKKHSDTVTPKYLICNIFICMHHLPYCTNKVLQGVTVR